jgi:hypothetical protein
VRHPRIAYPVLTALTATLALAPTDAAAQHRHRHRHRDREETAATPATPATPAAVPATDPDEAQYHPAIDAANRGQPEEALRIFASIYASTRAPRAVARMGTTEIQLGRWLAAEEHLTTALEARDDAWVQQRRDRLEEALGRVRENLASLTITGGVAGAQVRVNGNAAGTLPLTAPVRVQRGSVMIDVQADGHAPYQQVLSVTSADARTEVSLLPRPAANDTPPPAAPVAAPGPSQAPAEGPAPERLTPEVSAVPSPASSQSPLRPLGIASMVVGGLGIGVGVLGLVLRNGYASSFNNDPRCGAETLMGTPLNCRDNFNAGQEMQTVSVIGLVVGGVLAAAGVSMFAAAPREARPTAFRFNGGPGHAGLGLGWSF